jgi:hypothetical protein
VSNAGLRRGIFTLQPIQLHSNPPPARMLLQAPAPQATATIINGMRPRTIGRALGIGVRVAGRIAGQRVASHASSAVQPAPVHPAAHSVSAPAPDRSPDRAARELAGQSAQRVSQGVGGFLRPFRRLGSVLWLEVTGVLFLLPAVVFTPFLWRASVEYPHTADHKTFWSSAVVVVVFSYLGVSSFWRARRRGKRG